MITSPVPPSSVITSSFRELVTAQLDPARVEVDREAFAAGYARLAHPARDDGRVRGHAAVSGENAACLDQTVNVVGVRLPAHEDDRFTCQPTFLCRGRRRG